ncbi:hypothetical protein AYX15_07051 [Cryptococcus neoformans]|nr:hypothetical protein AYX15_07051 [Cryptococcus neoformans var. grubii]
MKRAGMLSSWRPMIKLWRNSTLNMEMPFRPTTWITLKRSGAICPIRCLLKTGKSIKRLEIALRVPFCS